MQHVPSDESDLLEVLQGHPIARSNISSIALFLAPRDWCCTQSTCAQPLCSGGGSLTPSARPSRQVGRNWRLNPQTCRRSRCGNGCERRRTCSCWSGPPRTSVCTRFSAWSLRWCCSASWYACRARGVAAFPSRCPYLTRRSLRPRSALPALGRVERGGGDDSGDTQPPLAYRRTDSAHPEAVTPRCSARPSGQETTREEAPAPDGYLGPAHTQSPNLPVKPHKHRSLLLQETHLMQHGGVRLLSSSPKGTAQC
jgi:hypothetical protein